MSDPAAGRARPGAGTDLSRLVAAVLGWADGARRDLPWRATRDPWAVLVSEAMLQQTQVSRVLARWGGFVERFPTPASAAGAPPAEVIGWWAGLGYNRRALALHRAAGQIVQRHGGAVPGRLPDLLALAGVGPYTARAVLAFAFGAEAGVVDTNVGRVLARAVAGRRLRPAEAQQLADRLVPPGAAWAWNQALLDFGALVCTARNPSCAGCVLADGLCAWRAAGGNDPAVGSAGVGGAQTVFEGSDRQGRGRLVDALRSGVLEADDVAGAAGWPADAERARRVLRGLVADGLAVEVGEGRWSLPGATLGAPGEHRPPADAEA